MVALMLLAVDPAQIKKQIDRPVLLPDEKPTTPIPMPRHPPARRPTRRLKLVDQR